MYVVVMYINHREDRLKILNSPPIIYLSQTITSTVQYTPFKSYNNLEIAIYASYIWHSFSILFFFPFFFLGFIIRPDKKEAIELISFIS